MVARIPFDFRRWQRKLNHLFLYYLHLEYGVSEGIFCVALFRYPYNWRAPRAYFITVMILGILFICEALIYTSCNILYFGACKFLVAFCADFKDSLKKLDEKIIEAAKSDKRLAIVKRITMKRMFNDLVKFHCDMIDLAEKCSSTYNGIVASFIFLGGCYWCTNLIEVHLVSKYRKGV